MSQLQRFSSTDLAVYWGPENALQLGNVLRRCAKTEVCVLPHIDRDEALKPDPRGIPHIKRQHCFTYENGLCFRAELSTGAEQKRFEFLLRPSS